MRLSICDRGNSGYGIVRLFCLGRCRCRCSRLGSGMSTRMSAGCRMCRCSLGGCPRLLWTGLVLLFVLVRGRIVGLLGLSMQELQM